MSARNDDFDQYIDDYDDLPQISEPPLFKRRTVILFAIGITALVVGLFALRAWSTASHAPVSYPVSPSVGAVASLIQPPPEEQEKIKAATIAALSVPSGRVQGSFDGFCFGDETICTTATTEKPGEMLKRLADAMPQGTGKSYKVRVSITTSDL